jgi:hypothetical protein
MDGQYILLHRYLTPMEPAPNVYAGLRQSGAGAGGGGGGSSVAGYDPMATPTFTSPRRFTTGRDRASDADISLDPVPIVDPAYPRMQTCAALTRFVSLIPFIDDWHVFPDRRGKCLCCCCCQCCARCD